MRSLLMPIVDPNLTRRDKWVANAIGETYSPGMAVLDVGAGSGPYRKYFYKGDYKTQDFAQLSDEDFRQCSGYVPIDYVSDASKIPVEDAAFDVVLCTEVLEHVYRPDEVVGEIMRILKPGGRAIVTYPLGSGIHQAPHHYYGGFTPYWLKRLADDYGFAIEKECPNGGFFMHFRQYSVRAFRSLIKSLSIKSPMLSLFLIALAPISTFGYVLTYITSFILEKVIEDDSQTVGYMVVLRSRNAE